MSALDPEAHAFIVDHVESVEQLEVLLLLYHHARQEWSAQQVAAELRTEPGSAGRRLADLATRGLVEERGGGLYAFATGGRDAPRVERVARAYRERRVTVIGLIFSKPATPVRAFADAFRLKRSEEEE